MTQSLEVNKHCQWSIIVLAVVLLGSVFGAHTAPVDEGEADRARLVVTLTHSNFISAMAISADGRLLASAAWEGGSVVLWDTRTGQEIRRFKGDKDQVVRSAALSANGQMLLTGGDDNIARLWNTYSGEQVLELKGHDGAVKAVAFFPDGRLATGSEDMTVRIWDAKDGRPLVQLQNFDAEASDLAVTPNGKYLLTGGGLSAQLWDPSSGEKVRDYTGHQGGVSTVDISPDGRLVLTGSLDHTARLWDLETGREIRRFEGHTNGLTSVAFALNGASVLSAGHDKTVRMWDTETGANLGVPVVNDDQVSAIVAAPEADKAIFGAGKIPQAWRISQKKGFEKRLISFEGYSKWASSVAFSPDGRRFLIGLWDGSARLWSVETGRQMFNLKGHTGDVRGVAFSPDGRIAATAERDGPGRIWQTDTGAEVGQLKGHEKGIRPVVFSDDGHFLLTGGDDRTARIWDARGQYQQVHILAPHAGRVNAVAYSPDGDLAATASEHTVHLWSTRSGKEVKRLNEHRRIVNSVAFSPDGKYLLSAGWDNTLLLWHLDKGKVVQRFEGHSEGVLSVAFSPDGRYIASGGSDKALRLWQTDTGELLHRLDGHTGMIIQVAFAPDGRFLLSASADQTTRLWHTGDGQEICKLINFSDGGWAVVDGVGRFDASNGGDVAGLHWVVGMEPISLGQLREGYFDPGLLAKKMGYNDQQLLEVEAFKRSKLHPEMIIRKRSVDDPQLHITLINRGGGIGKTSIRINGNEVRADARSPGTDPSAKQVTLPPFSLLDQPGVNPGQENTIEIQTYNANGNVAGRGVVVYQAPGSVSTELPTLWAIVVGVSDYEGTAIDLNFAAKDAEDFAHALRIAGTRLFGEDHLKLKLLRTSKDPGTELPTRAVLQQAFSDAAKAKNTDLLVVYLAGHGVNHGGPDGEYYYLTKEASNANFVDSDDMQSKAVSSQELTEWIKAVPAQKRVLIMDTCAAGRLIEKMAATRNVSSSQDRAIQRMKDRTGLFILAGAAADAVSYETSRYGQGLLTWSLLYGMTGVALRESQFVDVSRLFNHAVDQVPKLAKDIGGIQKPWIATPRIGGGSFDLGQLIDEDLVHIRPIPPRPYLLKANIQEEPIGDSLKLVKLVNAALRDASAGSRDARFAFVDADDMPDSYRLWGRYELDGTKVVVRAWLFHDQVKKESFNVSGSADRLDELVKMVVDKVERLLDKQSG